MRLAIGADHHGVPYKETIKRLLTECGHVVEDFGSDRQAAVDYPDYALSVARCVAGGQCERGILICSTGIGMSIAANRVKGVRAALCLSEGMAETARRHNDSNVLCLGADLIDEQTALKILDRWLRTEFEGGRHSRRLRKIDEA